jgi:hypothetical protein
MNCFGSVFLRIVFVAAASACAILVSCISPSTPAGTVAIRHNAVIAGTASSDYAAGNMGFVDLADASSAQNCITIFSDNLVVTHGKSVFVLERAGKDNIIRFKEGLLGTGAVLYQKHLGQNLNIADMVFVSDTQAYVACNLGKKLLVVDPSPGAVVDSIDLSRFNAYAGTDSAAAIPYMQALALYNGKLYVACERLKTDASNLPQPADTSVVAVIDVANDSVVGAIALAKRNPYSMAAFGSSLYVVSTGAWGNASDGGIEQIDMVIDKNMGVVAEEALFGGDISSVCMVSDQKAYVAVAKNSLDFSLFWTELIEFNPATGAVGSKVPGVDNAFGGAVYDGTYLYVGDRSKTNPGVVAIDPSTNTKAGGPYNMGLPPSSLAFLKLD